MDLTIAPNSRTYICGKTKSGKSTLAHALLDSVGKRSIVIVDPKGDFNHHTDSSSCYICETLEEVNEASKENAEIIIFRPPFGSYSDYDAIFTWIFRRGHTVVYIDELYLVMDGPRKCPESLKALYTNGRTRGITVIAGSQRPREIPTVCMSESEQFCIFQLLMDEDRKRVASFVGKAANDMQTGHYFWYRNEDMTEPLTFIL